jgi:protein phosphatase
MISKQSVAVVLNSHWQWRSFITDYARPTQQLAAGRCSTDDWPRTTPLTQIALPRNTLLVLVGPAGCGKSTFAARHFLPTQVVSSDECRALISDDPTNQQVSGDAFDLMKFIIEKRLMLGKLTVADATHLSKESRRPMIHLAARFGFNSAALVFDVPLEVCLVRNAGRQRVVPEQALARQHVELQITLQAVRREGFSHVFVLDQIVQREATVVVKRRASPPNTRSQTIR